MLAMGKKMISIIIFVVAVVLIYILNLFVFLNTFSWWLIALIEIVSVIGMILINAIIATLYAKCCPDKWFLKESRLFMSSKKECTFYEKLGIKKWKDLIIELGATNNFRKNKIKDPNDPEYVKKFII